MREQRRLLVLRAKAEAQLLKVRLVEEKLHPPLVLQVPEQPEPPTPEQLAQLVTDRPVLLPERPAPTLVRPAILDLAETPEQAPTPEPTEADRLLGLDPQPR